MKRSDYAHFTGVTIMVIMLLIMGIPLLNPGDSLTFKKNTMVLNDNPNQESLQVGVTGSGETATVFVAYEDHALIPDTHVKFRRSVNGGDRFTFTKDFLPPDSTGYSQKSPTMASLNSLIAIAFLDSQWELGPTNKYLLRVVVSEDAGSNWGYYNITQASGTYPNNKMSVPDICIDPTGNMFAVWIESSKAMISYSLDRGRSWSLPMQVKEHSNPQMTSYSQYTPTVACDGTSVVVAWYANPEYKEWVYSTSASTTSLPGALSFSEPELIPEYYYELPKSFYPQLIADGSAIHVAWWDFETDKNGAPNEDITKDRPCIKYSKSINGGDTFSVGGERDIIVNTSTPDGWHSEPDITLGSDGYIAITWYDYTQGNTNPNVFVSGSANGETWSVPSRVSDYDPGLEKDQPRVAIDDGGSIHVVWLSKDPDIGLDWDIMHSRSIINLPPEPVKNLVEIGYTEFSGTIKWDINTEPDFEKYTIHLSNTSDFVPSLANQVYESTKQNLDRYEFTGLSYNTFYFSKVVVIDAEGLKSQSEEVYFKTDVINLAPRFEEDIDPIYMEEDGRLEGALNLSYWFEQGWVWDDNYKGQTTSLGLYYEIIPTSEDPKVTAILSEKGDNQTYWTLDLYTNEQNWAGTEKFTIKVMDAGKDMGFNTQDDLFGFSNEFIVQVNSTNDLPIWAKFEDIGTSYTILLKSTQKVLKLDPKSVSCREDSQYSFGLSSLDIDGDFIVYTASDPRIKVDADKVDPQHKSIFRITPTNSDVPELNFTVTADDTNGGTRNLTVILPVTNVNDLPFFVSVNGTPVEGTDDEFQFTIDEEESIEFNVEAGDIDANDVLTLSTDSDRPRITKINDTIWNIKVESTKEDASVGSIGFILSLLDREKTYPSKLGITIKVNNLQDQPFWTPGKKKIDFWARYDERDVNEWVAPSVESARPEWGEPVLFQAFAQDLDADALNYTWRFSAVEGTEDFYRYESRVYFSFFPTDGNLSRTQNERFIINLTVTDSYTPEIYYQFEMVIWPDDDNDNDGLPDMREKFFWGDLSAGPDEDPDNDGYNNSIEIGFSVPLFDSEKKTPYSLNRNEIDPLNPNVRPGQAITGDDEIDNDEEENKIPVWIIVTAAIIIVIILGFIISILVIIRQSKKKDIQEEIEIEKKVEEMEKRQKEIAGLYGGKRIIGEDFGPDQSTLSDLKIDLGGSVYHTDGTHEHLVKDKSRDEGPAWQSAGGSGPLFDESRPGLELGESLKLEAVPEDEVMEEEEVDYEGSMDELMSAADEYDEEAVKNAGGNVLVGAVPMEEQIKRMQGGEAAQGGPRIPPPGQKPPQPTPGGIPPGQAPPTVGGAPSPARPPVIKPDDQE
ncbi:MAG: hypothetical protein ACMUIG_08965 [Thermoplasmatota archaeon]